MTNNYYNITNDTALERLPEKQGLPQGGIGCSLHPI